MNERLTEEIKYYDSIAGDYDLSMEKDYNKNTRAAVAAYVKTIPNVNMVLDFGAGTGKDLDWQLKAGYGIVYYEPSTQMAAIAKTKYNIEANPQIIEVVSGDRASYTSLKKYSSNKFDLIFSNFAAINSIEDINLLFNTFTEILKEGGNAVCVLYFKNNNNAIQKIKKFLNISSKVNTINVVSDKSGQTMRVFVHTKGCLKKAARSNGMKMMKDFDLADSDFRLFHFVK